MPTQQSHPHYLTSEKTLPFLLFALLATAKVIGLLIYGPLFQPDSGDYLSYSRLIFSSTEWLHDGGMENTTSPQTVFRIFGYPLILGSFQNLFGKDTGLYFVVLLQIGISLIATISVYQFGKALLKNWVLGLVASAGFALSVTFTYDQHILTDSLFNNLFVIAMTRPLTALLNKEIPSARLALCMGTVFAAACLIRGIGIYMTFFIVPAYLYWIAKTKNILTIKTSQILSFMLPIIIVIGGVHIWNNYRTGYTFYTTGAQYVLIQGPVIIEGRGTPIFTGDTPIDKLGQKFLKTYTYPEVGKITDGLNSEYGLDAYQSAKAHSAKYFSAFMEHPAAFLLHGIQSYEESLIFQFYSLLDNTLTYFKFAEQRRLWPGSKGLIKEVLDHGNITYGLILIGVSIGRVIAWVSFVTLLIGPLIILGRTLFKKEPLSTPNLIIFYSWGVYFSYSYGLCLIHMVDRFLPAVLPLGMATGLFCYQRLYNGWKEREIKREIGEF